METINKVKSSTALDTGQPAEMSLEEKMRKLAAAFEVLETAIERALRAKFGIPA